MGKKISAVGTVIIISIFFRFFRFPQLFHWTMDEDFWSYLPQNIATGYHFPAIGGHIGGTGLYSGPTFIYLMAIPAKIFSGNPLGFGILVAAIGVLTAYLMYLVGRRMFGLAVGLLASFLYSSSFLMAIFDRHYWNASLTPILSLLTIWFVWEVHQKRLKFVIPLALELVLAFHAHGTGMALLIFTALAWIFFRLPVRSRWVAAGVGIFLLFQLPLVFFDVRHDWQNTRALASYLTTSKGGTVPLTARVGNVAQGFVSAGSRLVYFPAKDLAIEQTLGLAPQYAALKGQAPLWASAFFAVALLAAFFLPQARMMLLLVGSTLVGLLIYKEKIPEYFFSPTFVPLFFIFALFLKRIARPLTVLFLIIFFCLNLNNLLTVKHTFGYPTRLAAVQEAIAQVGNKPFVLEAKCAGFCQLYGFRYLFTYLHHEPVASYVDSTFLWLYQDRLPKVAPQKKVLLNMADGKVNVYVSDYR
ncbi:MAG: glycosyltransferase family 39 protein [Patescibacteria group bacterium]|nr:glycosyltransferase family 39 protein [Patescibacteria group bacterium]MCL5431686.1 glycosyltransferase family 39 protein [Patescibacteria group bacterium]